MKSKIIAILSLLGFVFASQTIINPGTKIKKVVEKNIEVVDKAPTLSLSAETLYIIEGEELDLLKYATAEDDYDNVKVLSNIANTQDLKCGTYKVVYTVIDRKDNKTEETLNLEVLRSGDDFDKDGYTNLEEKNAGKNYYDITSFPAYDKAPTIMITNFQDIIKIGNDFKFQAYAQDVADGFLNVEIFTNINKNIAGNYYVVFRAIDSLGNQSMIRKDVRVIDDRILEFTKFEVTDSSWTVKDVVVSYEFNKPLMYVEYSFDNQNWSKTYDKNITLNKSMNEILYVRGVDYQAKKSDAREAKIQIDKELPVINNTDITVEASKVNSFNCDAISANSLSGIQYTETTNNVLLNTVGTYSCKYTAINNAGNASTKEVAVNVIDTTAPTLLEENIKIEPNTSVIEQITIEDNSINNISVTIDEFDNTVAGENLLNIVIADEYGNKLETQLTVIVEETEVVIVEDIHGTQTTIKKFKNDPILSENLTINNIELNNHETVKDGDIYKRLYSVDVEGIEDDIEVSSDILSIIENNQELINIEVELNGGIIFLNYSPGVGFSLM